LSETANANIETKRVFWLKEAWARARPGAVDWAADQIKLLLTLAGLLTVHIVLKTFTHFEVVATEEVKPWHYALLFGDCAVLFCLGVTPAVESAIKTWRNHAR
jgi:hypothetical protein